MPNLADLFASMHDDMKSALNKAAIASHPVAKGDGTEGSWLSLLQTHLPFRYKATKGFVIDARDNVSDQIDIIIHDRQFSPLIWEHEGQVYLPAESVYAVLEVKQELSRAHIDYAGRKVASVRRLHRSSLPVRHAGGTYPARVPFDILGGLVTTRQSWTSDPDHAAFVAALRDHGGEQALNLGCVAREFSFDAQWSGGALTGVEVSSDGAALLWFFLRLLHRLQGLATVPALDLNAYAAHAGSGRALPV
jgi:hypothetical protein